MSEQAVFDALKHRVVVNEYGIRGYYNSADQLHRTNGPAVIWADGTKWWMQNGQLHRTDGAAIEWCDGDKFWFINGRMMTEAEFVQAINPL